MNRIAHKDASFIMKKLDLVVQNNNNRYDYTCFVLLFQDFLLRNFKTKTPNKARHILYSY